MKLKFLRYSLEHTETEQKGDKNEKK